MIEKSIVKTAAFNGFDFSTPEKINQYVIDIVFPKRGVWMYNQEDLDAFRKPSINFGYTAA